MIAHRRLTYVWPAVTAVTLTTSAVAFSHKRGYFRRPLHCDDGKKGPSLSLEDLSDKVTSLIPSDPFSQINESFSKAMQMFDIIQKDFSLQEGSLFDRVVKKADPQNPDLSLHPEMRHEQARVRVGTDIGAEEQKYIMEKRRKMRVAFANYIGVSPFEVDERDIPVVAFAASGGGYRAMVSTLGLLQAAKETGLWDIASYASGISGSCWALNVLYTIGDGDPQKAIDHICKRIQTHFMSPELLDILTTRPTNELLLSGLILKNKEDLTDTNLVDIYGTLVSSRLYLADDAAQPLHPDVLRLSNQAKLIAKKTLPLPLYCMIRHEIPDKSEEVEINKKGGAAKKTMMTEADALKKDLKTARKKDENKSENDNEEQKAAEKSRWMWFEASPFETGSDELGAFIPTWALGRKFDNGVSTNKTPEASLTVLTGIFASAFCATLLNYFNEVSPVLSQTAVFNQVKNWILDNYESHLDAIHPFPPSALPSFVKNMDPKLLGDKADEIITHLDYLEFIDAGANLNVPYVPLFRRNCDVVIALDASADSQGLWFSRAQEYASERSLETWPKVESDFSIFEKRQSQEEDESISEKIASMLRDGLKEGDKAAEDGRLDKVKQAKHHETHVTHQGEDNITNNPTKPGKGSAPTVSEFEEPPIGKFNVWLGGPEKSESGMSRNDDPSVKDILQKSGIVLVYYPLMGEVNNADLYETWSTWRFEYPEKETRDLVDVSRANFKEGDERLRTVLKGVWLRKKRDRTGQEHIDP